MPRLIRTTRHLCFPALVRPYGQRVDVFCLFFFTVMLIMARPLSENHTEHVMPFLSFPIPKRANLMTSSFVSASKCNSKHGWYSSSFPIMRSGFNTKIILCKIYLTRFSLHGINCRVITKIEVRCSRCEGLGKLSVVNPDSLRSARKKAGISLRAIAVKLGLSAPYVSDIELGRRACPARVEQVYSNLDKLNQRKK